MLWDRAWNSGEAVGRVFDDLPVAVVVLDLGRVVTYVNRQFEALTLGTRADILGRDLSFLWGERSDVDSLRALATAFEAGLPLRDTVYSSRLDGTGFWNRLALTPVRDSSGVVASFIVFMEDVSEEVEDRHSGAEHARTGRVLIGAAAAFAATRDRSGVAAALAAAVVDGGALWAAVIGESMTERFRVDGVARAADCTLDEPLTLGVALAHSPELEEAMRTPGPRAVDLQSAEPPMRDWMRRTGLRQVLITSLPTGAAAQALIIAVWRAEDRAGAASLERIGRLAELGAIALQNVLLLERLATLAERDQLTGAASRTAFQFRLEAALDTALGEVGLIYVDVDRFKQVNDSLGHSGGDAVLSQLFDRVAGAVDDGTVVGRTGGDEFVLLVEGADIPRRVAAFMDWIGQVSFEPFDIEGQPVHVGCSAGAAIGHRRSEESNVEAAARLVKLADEEMYVAKRRKRGWRRLETQFDVVQLEAGLHRAAERDEVAAQFQPQFDAATGRLTGFETLARWQHPVFGAVPPDVFIPLADETGLIDAIGDRILQQAFDFAERMSARGAIEISVNLSGRQIRGDGFADRFAAILSAHPSRTWAVTAEIAESDLGADRALVDRVLGALRSLGVDVAVDNFGSGQSSLALLQELPITAIKIDKSFVRRVGALGGGMIGAIVNLARGLGLSVIAEGVDHPEQLAVLQQLGCDRLQGYLLAAPMNPDDAFRAPLSVHLAPLGSRVRRTKAHRRAG